MVRKFLSQIEMQVAPTAPTHVARLQDVEDKVNRTVKSPVRVATTGNLAATYDSDEKTLTATADGALTVDGVAVAAGDRVLVKDQTDKTQNGIYTVTVLGDASTAFVLTRATDFDSNNELIPGVRIHVAAGTSNSGQWYLSSSGTLTLDSSNLEFVRDTPSTNAVKVVYAIVGDGTTTTFDFSHSWGTYDVSFTLYEATTGEEVTASYKRTSVNDVRVEFGYAPAVGEDYRLVLTAVLDN